MEQKKNVMPVKTCPYCRQFVEHFLLNNMITLRIVLWGRYLLFISHIYLGGFECQSAGLTPEKCILIIPRVSPEDLFWDGRARTVYKITTTAESAGSVLVCLCVRMGWGFWPSSLCGLHQIRARSSDRTGGRASLNPAGVYLDIAAGWKVNTGEGQQTHTSNRETRDGET